MAGGAPTGNQNAAKGKRWLAAVERALERRSKAAGQKDLDEIADKFVEAAANGEPWAIKEIGDRFDGKPTATIEAKGSMIVQLLSEDEDL